MNELIRLSRPEIFHIMACMEGRKREGSYYGPREQFWKRHDRIESKLDHALEIMDIRNQRRKGRKVA